MTGVTEEKMIYLPNRETIMMRLMRSGLETFIKSKVMKKKTTTKCF